MKKSLGAQTILYPTPVVLVGAYDGDRRPNIMTCSWAGICSSRPPCVTVSLREATYTYGCILRGKAYTVSIPSASQVKQTDFAGMHSGRDTDKFAKLGWTAARAQHVDAPYVEQCPVVIECKLLHTLEVGLHTMFVGEIMDVKADAGVLDANGHVDTAALQPFSYDPSGGRYYGTGASLGKAFSVGGEL